MDRVRVLDCTLRDGGYINQWNFGEDNILTIVESLDKARVEIIEVGFLTNKIVSNKSLTKFNDILDISKIIELSNSRSMHVCMINFGEYELKDIPNADTNKVDGIRVAFHKKDMYNAIEFSKKIGDKGYKVFLQPMVAANYSDLQYLELIELSNKINPYAFYVVDSFGVMTEQDMTKYFFMADYNLSENCYIGFHSHNNIQLSYSNAQALIKIKTNRELIIDSSIYGMGRGAGNLNTELFLDYLNSYSKSLYDVKPLLSVIDFVLTTIYEKTRWGYSLPHYLSAVNNCHPNYATYLDGRNTLNVSDISEILNSLPIERKNSFDQEFIRNQYISYLENLVDNRNDIEKVKQEFKGKQIILVAPGMSVKYLESDSFSEQIKNSIVISVNYIPKNILCDYVFFSNKKRYNRVEILNNENVMITSNIIDNGIAKFIVDYTFLRNNINAVEDNSGLMLIELLSHAEPSKILLAGFDGYTYDYSTNNYASDKLSIVQSKEKIEKINLGMNYLLNEYAKKINIEFLTEPVMLKIFS